MLLVLIIYIVLALLLFAFRSKTGKYSAIFIAVFQLGVFTWLAFYIPSVYKGFYLSKVIPWIPELGLSFHFLLDGISLSFALIITGIGALVFLYAHSYMKHYENKVRFYIYLLLFSGAMLGLVLSVNVIQLFIFWELTSIFSFFLISFFNEKETARKAAFQSLFITGTGGLSLLAGLLLIGSITGSYQIDNWISSSETIAEHRLYLPALLLILLGVFTKSAQFPFHFWLPGAMQAPTPVSSYLHSATMVKAGIFLLARLNPVLGGTTEWTHIIPFFGALTMLVGAYMALVQTDLKAILAYTTISSLGVLTLLFGIGTALSVKAALVFLFVHAFYKATLFMITGIIDKLTGTRDIRLLRGILRLFPITFIVTLLALLSMAGLPPMLGFIGKELIYEAKIQSPGIASLVLIFGVTSNVLMVAISFYLLHTLFFTTKQQTQKIQHKKIFLMLTGPIVLAFMSLAFGIFPETLKKLMEPALNDILSIVYPIKLKIWHGFNSVFFLSLFTVLTGTTIALIFIKKPKLLERWRKFNSRVFDISLSDLFIQLIEKIVKISERNTKLIQHGYYRYYVLTIVFLMGIFLWFQLYITRDWSLSATFSLQPYYNSGLVFAGIVATIFSVTTQSRWSAIIAMGVVGYSIALIFLYYSAVDLAITQLIVETLIVAIFALVLQRLPRFAKLSGKKERLRDVFIALIFGSAATLLALKAIHVEFNHPVSDFYLENSYLKAFGENVVNVILVDFRALDTLGEVTVLTIAAIGVYVLLTRKKETS